MPADATIQIPYPACIRRNRYLHPCLHVFAGTPRCWFVSSGANIPFRGEDTSTMLNFWRSLSFRIHLKLGRLTVSVCFKSGSTAVRQ